ncbi:ABC transporter ATP-binding protein [Nitriliruptoraceae bacterium ZYF776]|nr:ABC transporter ATP-binding protein [Profundirhabdus halotolerans]
MRAQDVVLEFGGVRALKGVNIAVGDDETVAVIGPNGAGKTSLLNVLCGFYKPKSGTVTFKDRNITRLREHKIARMGVGRTFQGVHLFAGMTVLDNIMVGRYNHMTTNMLQSFLYFPWVHREELAHRERVEDIIDFLELETVRGAVVGELGYGLRKRVDLGRALAMEPDILLMDEPMAGMNLEEKEDLARFILDIREARHIPIVIVEHDMHVVMDIADRIVVLDFGEVIGTGAPDEIQRNEKVIEAYLGGAV